jgi:hypothetical protein
MKRYISIFISDNDNLRSHLGTFDSKTHRWTQLSSRMKDASGKFEHRMLAYLQVMGLSHNSERWDGPYERNAKGEILQGHIPERLSTVQVEESLYSLLHPKPSKRGMSAKSIANLRPDLIRCVRHKTESQFSQDDYTKAENMRETGRTWKEIGDWLGCHQSAIKTAMFRRSKQLTGGGMAKFNPSITAETHILWAS